MFQVPHTHESPAYSEFFSFDYFFFFNDTATTEIYTLSLHDALPILSSRSRSPSATRCSSACSRSTNGRARRSEEHTSELQSPNNLVCRLLLEKNKQQRSDSRSSVCQQCCAVEVHARLCRALSALRSYLLHLRYVVDSTFLSSFFFFLNDTAPPEFYTLPLPAALPI